MTVPENDNVYGLENLQNSFRHVVCSIKMKRKSVTPAIQQNDFKDTVVRNNSLIPSLY